MAGCLRLGLTDPYCFFFFNDTATTEIYTLSLHDALPISRGLSRDRRRALRAARVRDGRHRAGRRRLRRARSEEHTSELQSPCNLVCRLLLEKKNELLVFVEVHRDS